MTSTAQLDDSLDTAPEPTPRFVGPWIEMLVSSLLGLLASFVLSIDALVLAENPNADLSCNVSSTISCGTVGTSWQASLLGFPNAFLGILFESIVIAFAVAGLGRAIFPRWYMLGIQALYTIALAFAYWLFFQAYFVIGAMCPWCLLITGTTLLVFTSMTRINFLSGHFGEGVKRRLEPALNYYLDVYSTVIILAIVAAMVIVKYV